MFLLGLLLKPNIYRRILIKVILCSQMEFQQLILIKSAPFLENVKIIINFKRNSQSLTLILSFNLIKIPMCCSRA